jgi:hypothetical protein
MSIIVLKQKRIGFFIKKENYQQHLHSFERDPLLVLSKGYGIQSRINYLILSEFSLPFNLDPKFFYIYWELYLSKVIRYIFYLSTEISIAIIKHFSNSFTNCEPDMINHTPKYMTHESRKLLFNWSFY